MRILMVSSYLPYPLFSGGHIRLYNIIRGLSLNHKITFVCEKRDYQTKEDVEKIEKFCKKVIVVDRKKQWTFPNIVKAGISFSPFLIVGHTNKLLKQAITEVLNSEKFDLIHVETSYVMQNVPQVDIPIVLVEHNIEHLVYKRFVDVAPIFIRPLLYYDVIKLRHFEEEAWKKATKLVAVSEQEKRLMKREDTVVVPNGVDVDKFKAQSAKRKTKKEERRILFIGDFKWVQNRDTAEWILTAIWPKVKSSLKLWIVGRKIPQNIKDLGDESVIFDEDAPIDTSLIYQKADILLAPIRVGGGTSFKILEAMSCGVPVVTTRLGIEGIGAEENKEALVSETAEGLANHVIDILEDEKLYKTISQNARKLIEKKYDWKIIVERLEEVYKSAVAYG
jgi:glycosyltransferase involved in cell wall biosynthesis